MRIKHMLAAGTLAVTALAGFSGTAAHASVKAPTWQQKTCTAFGAWQAHRTAGNLVTLATDSLHVPWRYLGGDVWQLVDVVHAVQTDTAAQKPGDVKYLAVTVRYVAEDC